MLAGRPFHMLPRQQGRWRPPVLRLASTCTLSGVMNAQLDRSNLHVGRRQNRVRRLHQSRQAGARSPERRFASLRLHFEGPDLSAFCKLARIRCSRGQSGRRNLLIQSTNIHSEARGIRSRRQQVRPLWSPFGPRQVHNRLNWRKQFKQRLGKKVHDSFANIVDSIIIVFHSFIGCGSWICNHAGQSHVVNWPHMVRENDSPTVDCAHQAASHRRHDTLG